MTNTYCCLYSI